MTMAGVKSTTGIIKIDPTNPSLGPSFQNGFNIGSTTQ